MDDRRGRPSDDDTRPGGGDGGAVRRLRLVADSGVLAARESTAPKPAEPDPTETEEAAPAPPATKPAPPLRASPPATGRASAPSLGPTPSPARAPHLRRTPEPAVAAPLPPKSDAVPPAGLVAAARPRPAAPPTSPGGRPPLAADGHRPPTSAPPTGTPPPADQPPSIGKPPVAERPPIAGRPPRSDRRPPAAPAAPVAPVEQPAAAPAEAEPRRLTDRAARQRRRSVSKLTLRVLAVNILALAILVAGLLYLGRYEDRLIQAELGALRTEAMILSTALAEGAAVGRYDEPQGVDPGIAQQMVRRLYEITDTRTRVFDVDGRLIADSRQLGEPGGVIEVQPLAPMDDRGWIIRGLDDAVGWLSRLVPDRREWPTYRERAAQRAGDYRSVVTALTGDVDDQIWAADDGGLILGTAVPVQRLRIVMGAVLVTTDSVDIERAMRSVRADILSVFIGALIVTVLLSVYLASSITRPIRRLAQAAERVRRGHTREHSIPDFSARRDEIGDLSRSLRDMTEALWTRMDATERFAADVAHEIKNPLTSLRSAVETTARISDPEQQRRLLSIIVEDVQRLNRLISDISDASRLDSELSRASAEPVDMPEMLRMLADLYVGTAEEGGPLVVAVPVAGDAPLVVAGLEGRLVQVFRNLIGNAISFSPPGERIELAARRDGDMVEVTVSDRGPGIPPNKLQAIFDRFYSERPAREKFGAHSGLGLSISRQIVEAHAGTIAAENRQDGPGARFTVRIPAL